MPDKMNDTRRLLKVFGVAVTDFEERSAELLDAAQKVGPDDGDELSALFSELLSLVRDTNEKWLAVTVHMFEKQQDVLERLLEAAGGALDS